MVGCVNIGRLVTRLGPRFSHVNGTAGVTGTGVGSHKRGTSGSLLEVRVSLVLTR